MTSTYCGGNGFSLRCSVGSQISRCAWSCGLGSRKQTFNWGFYDFSMSIWEVDRQSQYSIPNANADEFLHTNCREAKKIVLENLDVCAIRMVCLFIYDCFIYPSCQWRYKSVLH